VDLNAGGEISDRKIGTTPNALRSTNCKLDGTLSGDLRDLPLNTELNPESAGGELVECIRDDPERDEHSNEEDRSTRKERATKLGVV
jgi:hypothetical protein